MRKPGFRYWVLGLFLFVITVVVFLQFISGYNINRLIMGNRSLMREIELQKQLRNIETDLVSLESDIRGAVISGNDQHLQAVDQKTQDINRSLQKLKSSYKTDLPAAELERLEYLIHQRLLFNRQVLAAYRSQSQQAKLLIGSGRGKELKDSITQIIAHLDQIRQKDLGNIVQSLEGSGGRARLWGLFIAIVAIIAIIGGFWKILKQRKEQEEIIRRLNDSEQRSKNLAKIKEQFLANMSHEIRTPLNSILGFTNLLKRSPLTEDQRKYVQNIHTAGENLMALVNDILDLSKIEAGMMVFEETRFSLHSLVSSVGAMFSEKVREKGLKFQLHIDKNVPDILSGDAVRLTQILVNLISNGVKFTEEGEIKVDISLVEATEQRATIRIKVSDTGIGIAPAKQATIFERFQQAETETTRRFGGSGLGLSIVKQLVELQKGRIYLNSHPGKGSQFVVELNYNLPDINQLFCEALAAQEEIVSLQKIRALIAEDNTMNQLLISHLMKSWGIDFYLVNNGREVIEELKKNQYSIVLMDIQMPEMDGYTATGIIRNELRSDIPIIAMTAHAMAGEKEKCLRLGMNDYVSKPIKETVLYNIIARHAQHLPEPAVNGHLVDGGHKINLNALHELSGGDKAFEKQMLQQFVQQVEEELNGLELAIENNDFGQVRRLAHNLKSTVGYIGLEEELYPYLQQIEDAAAREEKQLIAENFGLVSQKCEQARKNVKVLLDEGSL